MRKFMSGLLATTLAVSFAAASAVPVNAETFYVPQAPVVSPEVQNVAWRGRDKVYRRHGHSYWRGHRGYRHHRRGYRRHGDLWFPLAAFAAGAIVSGAISNSRPAYGGNAHVQWCYDRYRSYRASDNTYQPYNGPRRQCYSPY